MKRFLAVCTLVVLSCNGIKEDNIKSFIPGTYVKLISNEFNKGNDTLHIRLMDNNTFSITRVSVFNRIREGKITPVVRKSEIWTAIYNHDEQVLYETQKGKVLSFLPKQKMLLIGSSEYKKINN